MKLTPADTCVTKTVNIAERTVKKTELIVRHTHHAKIARRERNGLKHKQFRPVPDLTAFIALSCITCPVNTLVTCRIKRFARKGAMISPTIAKTEHVIHRIARTEHVSNFKTELPNFTDATTRIPIYFAEWFIPLTAAFIVGKTDYCAGLNARITTATAILVRIAKHNLHAPTG